jgi:hypothetical protein
LAIIKLTLPSFGLLWQIMSLIIIANWVLFGLLSTGSVIVGVMILKQTLTIQSCLFAVSLFLLTPFGLLGYWYPIEEIDSPFPIVKLVVGGLMVYNIFLLSCILLTLAIALVSSIIICCVQVCRTTDYETIGFPEETNLVEFNNILEV